MAALKRVESDTRVFKVNNDDKVYTTVSRLIEENSTDT